MRVEQLTADHLQAVLDFETANRDYFAGWVPDRGDEFFADYPARHANILALQEAGTDIFHVVLADDGSVIGRVNLIEIADGEAELGYRVGRESAGRGLATAAVGHVCQLARSTYGLERLRAQAAADNHASRKVLSHNGFVIVGESMDDGHQTYRFRLDLGPDVGGNPISPA